MKLQTLDEAQSGQFSRLTNAQLLGDYAPVAGGGTTVGIFEKDGHLTRRIDGQADREPICVNGNRYRPAQLPDRFAISFRADQGKTELLLEEPPLPPIIRMKR